MAWMEVILLGKSKCPHQPLRSFLFLDIHISTTPAALERDFRNIISVLGKQRGQRCKNWSHQVLFLLQKNQKVLILTEKLNSLLRDALPASPQKNE